MSMTTEQREAIDRLSSLLKKGKYGVAGKTLLYEDYYMLKNVLEVVENQERKIIKQQEEIEKKDKIIDLMADKINEAYCNETSFWNCFEEIFGIRAEGNYSKEIKQYFANKVNSSEH